MNDRKIAFIYCVNDFLLYEESLRYVNSLHVPDGYEIEVIAIEGATSMTSGYNHGMQQTDAKYKVYLHQDVFIINNNFITDILNLFEKHIKLGLLGVAGSKSIPKNGIWWESAQRFGKVYDSHKGYIELLSFETPHLDYEYVQAVDGLIIITQYDFDWREDFFKGWHFYDLSQCQEFILAGYEVGVVKQDEPWCIHDCGFVNTKNGYDEYRKNFLDVYQNSIINLNKQFLPLVSILIPAYNQTEYLGEALESAINQTYPNIEIIIGDDSTNDKVRKFLEPYLKNYSYIKYFKNEKETPDFGYTNHVNCFLKSKGEFINFLNHDDIFHPKKIECMMWYFLQEPNITLVTSARNLIDENGNTLSSKNSAFQKIFKKDTIVSGHEMCELVVKTLTNFIGEPTTVLFKKRYIDESNLFYFKDHDFGSSIGDIAMWFTLLQYGNAVYIAEPLSYFRIHSSQNSNKPEIMVNGVIDWYQLIQQSFKAGIIKNTIEYKESINKWLNTFLPVIKNFIECDDYVGNELKQCLIQSYKEAIEKILNSRVINYSNCPVCKDDIERFLPYQFKEHKSDFVAKFSIIGSDTENFTCPICNCHDRTRHLFLYFDKLNIWGKYIKDKTILHIAPESHIQQKITSIGTVEYICGDLYPTNSSIQKIDVTDIPFNDEYFDFIICNHVLEHIPNDRIAMKELYRVLKPGGYAVLQTPFSPIIENSFEDIAINTNQKRKEFYGQDDHVRVYGLDFFERLKSTGFRLKIIKNDEIFSRDECKKYGVNYKEDMILVTK